MTRNRIARLREMMHENELPAYLITSYENYRYFSGFSGSNCTLIITQDKLFALTDGRYDVQIHTQAKGYEITVISETMQKHIGEILRNLKVSSVGYETHKITDFHLNSVKKACGEDISFIPCPDFGEKIRAIKDAFEISSVRKAAKIADAAFSNLCKKLSHNMTERDAAAYLEYEMMCAKSEGAAFTTIAASAERGAMPHAQADDVIIPDNTLMTFDFGAKSGGYCSDITRTVHIGTPKKELSDLWDAVFEVQQKCLKKVKADIPCRELDLFARDEFSHLGLEKHFSHSLGHGVGLAIHESPTLSKRSEAVLSENMIVTIEPGLYIEGLGGVRIEDSVLVTRDGCEILTHAPYRTEIKF